MTDQFPPVVHRLNAMLTRADERLIAARVRQMGELPGVARGWVQRQPIERRLLSLRATEEIDARVTSANEAPEGADPRSHALDRIAAAELRDRGVEWSVDAYVEAVERAERALEELGL